MLELPPYKKLFITGLVVFVFSFGINELINHTFYAADVPDLPENYFPLEGYVASKRIDTVWITSEPVGIGDRIRAMYTSHYGPGTVIVSKHRDTEEPDIFRGLRVNQKRRVYGDHLRESFPGRISAYYVEVID